MNRKNITEAINYISPQYIDEATEYTGKAKITRNIWYRCLAAACFVFLFAISLPFAKNLFVSHDTPKHLLEIVTLIKYDNAYLEVIEDLDTAEKFGLKREITQNIIGDHIAYLQKEMPEAEHSGYIVSDKETDIQLLEYKPAPYKSVRILRDGDNYYYAVLCNYLVDSDKSMPIDTLFDLYGVKNSTDIVSITPIKNNTWVSTGEKITDSTVISRFFDEILKLSDYSFDEYHKLVFENKTEGNDSQTDNADLYTRVADNYKEIKLETKDGLFFVIGYCPDYSWLEVSQTLSYYQMSPQLNEWFKDNIQ